ncbi:hypothetical protein SARC_13945, partial [Sphaeroforma arctica JP610]
MHPQLEIGNKLQAVPGVLGSTKSRRIAKLVLQAIVVFAIVWGLASTHKPRNVPMPKVLGAIDPEVDLEKNEFVMYRSIGNDLPPRHE